MISYQSLLAKLSGVREYDSYATALCPVHDDHRSSLFIYEDGWVRCAACNWTGSFTKFEKELVGYIAPIVAAEITHTHNLSSDLFECEQECADAHQFLLEKYDPLASYLIRRKVEGRIIPQRLGFFDGWFTIPIYNSNHNFIGAVQRASPAKQSETGLRFSTPKDQKPLVYIPDYSLVNESDYLCVAFGMFDSLSLCELGLPSCTPTAGKNSMHGNMLNWCRKPILIIPDLGEENTAINLLTELGWRGNIVGLNYSQGMKDISDIFQAGQEEIILQQIKEALG